MHTPGPWKAEISSAMCYELTDRPNWFIMAGDIGEEQLADLGEHSKITEANARLMAAAPELLEVCNETLRCMAEMQETNELPRDTCPADLWNMAQAAIAKIRGES